MSLVPTAAFHRPNGAFAVARPFRPSASTRQNDWTSTTDALPEEGQPVQFILDYRDIAMTGIYSRREFSSRWSRYAPASISEWRYAQVHANFPIASTAATMP